MSKDYYVMDGSVRGQCNHKHRTIKGLARCLKQDRKACRSQGGYSDRYPFKMVDGKLEDLVGDELTILIDNIQGHFV